MLVQKTAPFLKLRDRYINTIVLISQVMPLQPNMQQSSIDIILFHQNKLILRASLLYIECVHVCVCFVLLDLYLFIQYRRFEYVSVCVLVFKCHFACVSRSGAEGSCRLIV